MMIAQILSHTPLWVWVLLAFLISRGLVALQPREVAPRRMLIIPVVFLIWGLVGIYGAGDNALLKAAAFLVLLAIGGVGGRWLGSISPSPKWVPESGMLAMPGSVMPLILICVAFAVKYAGSVALAIGDDPLFRANLAIAMAGAGGLFAGMFWGRTLTQFQRALIASDAPSDLAAIRDLALGRTGPTR